MSDQTTTLTTVEPRDDKEIVKRFLELFTRTNREKPKAADLAELKQMLSDHDDLKLWQRIATMARTSEGELLNRTMPNQAGLAVVWHEQQAQVRRDLGYKDAPEAEKFLITHVALCWLRLMIVETQHTCYLAGEHNSKTGLYWDKRLTEAQKRYTRAVESLAKVRTLTAATQLLETRTAAFRAPGDVRLLKAV